MQTDQQQQTQQPQSTETQSQQTQVGDTSSQKLDPIAEALDLAPLEVLPPESTPEVDTRVDDDYHYARCNIINAIDKGQEALSNLLNVASSSQHPRSYEVVATLIKTVSEANKDLLQIEKTKKDIQKEDAPQNQKVTNNLFVGSTTELQKMLKNLNDKK